MSEDIVTDDNGLLGESMVQEKPHVDKKGIKWTHASTVRILPVTKLSDYIKKCMKMTADFNGKSMEVKGDVIIDDDGEIYMDEEGTHRALLTIIKK